MACVQGGTFMLGDERGRPDERAPGQVYVDTFFMDRTEVTNAQYVPCIESGRCKKPMPFRGFGRPEQPVVAVSWFDAVAHCEMLGKRLPTEAEWERAAAGPDDTRYPWGDEPGDCSAVVVKTDKGDGCGTGRTANVGSRPAGHFGLFDMAGNVHEWVLRPLQLLLARLRQGVRRRLLGVNPRGPCGGEQKCPASACARCAAARGTGRSSARELKRVAALARPTWAAPLWLPLR